MRLKLSLLFVFVITYSWSQSGSTKTFTGNGTFPVPAGVTSIQVQAWGGGGSGGGASGAPLLLGRGAAGGGGGAYASNTILVTPGTTLNVVVASQTAGTTGAGITGGNSTITGFESSILAAGGSGGDANNAGGSPVGGIGGTIAASAGSTKFAGANGGNGNSWNLLGLLLSSGAGGAGAGSGGAGGTAVSGLLLSNAPGNAGSPPGGAGSGAINSASGTAQIGGAGAAGRVIISYSCANFSLTSTAATNICSASGTTSAVTLTGSAASLPVGNYVVTYNRSIPSATALTANLTVTTAGTGTFTAVGLTAAGSSTITITKLASESCSSNITTNNTAAITVSPATVGGSVNGGKTVCTGNLSGVLTLSGNTGSVVKWQSSVSPFSTWTDIVNTTTTYTSGLLTQTTQFRAVVQSGACAVVNSAAATVTVSPQTIAGTVSGGTTITSGSTSGLLTLSGHTGSVLKWQSSVSPFSTWTDIANTNTTYTSGPLTETTRFRAVVQSGECAIANSAATTVTVEDLPTITTAASAETVCSNPNGNYTTSLSYSATTGSPVSYSIVWNSSPSNNLVAVTDAVLPSSPITIDIPQGTTGGTYTGTLTVKNANGAVSAGSVFTVTINETPSITTTGTIASVCYSNALENSTLVYSGITGNPTSYYIDWSQEANDVLLTDQPNTPFAFSSWGGTIDTIEISPEVLPGTYSGTLYIVDGSCTGSQAVSITINQLPSIFVPPAAQQVCWNAEEQSTSLNINGFTTGSPTTYSIVWSSSPANSFVAVTDEALPAQLIGITIPAGTEPGTYTGTLTVKNANGCVSRGSDFIVTVNETPRVVTTGIIDAVCSSTNPQNGVLTFTDFEGNPTSYSIDWDEDANTASLADQGNTPFDVDPNGSIVTIAIPGAVPPGTYLGTMYISNGDCSQSQSVSVVINPLPKAPIIGTITDSGPNDNTGAIALTGLPYGDWSIKIDLGSLPLTTVYGSGDAVVLNPLSAGTYTLVLTNEATGCSAPPSIVMVPNTPEAPTIALASSTENACEDMGYNGTQTTLSYSGTTGNPITYSIVWDSSPENFFVDVTDAVLPTSPITIIIPQDIVEGTYSGTLTVKDANGVSSVGSTFNLTIGLTPEIIIYEPINPVCASTNSQNATLPYFATESNPTSYFIDWDETANNAFLQDQASTPVTLDHNGGTIDSIIISANAQAGSYSGTLHLVEGFCTGSVPISIVINPSPKVPIIGEITPATNEDPTGSIAFSGLPSGTNWGLVLLSGGQQDFVTGGNTESVVIDQFPPGDYKFRVFYLDTNCSSDFTETVIVPSIIWERPTSKVTTTGTTDLKSAGNSITVGIDNKVINVEAPNQIIKEVFVFDVSGKLLYNKNKVLDSKLVIADLRSSNQVLVVRVVLNNHQSEVKKVIY